MTRPRPRRTCGLLFAAALAAWPGCGGPAGGQAAGAPDGPGAPGGREAARFPVAVATVRARRVEARLAAVGSLEAFEQVQVTARVAGVIERVRFAEGDRVERGRALVEIEPERYRLAVEAAEAALARAEAARAEADEALARRDRADRERPGLIRGEELDATRTRARVAAADTAERRVAVERARLDLRDAFVRAPIAGVLQTRSAQTGQYVQPGAVLATLVRRDPLLLRFQVPEADATRLRVGMAARFRVRGQEAEQRAAIVHVAAAADPTTRMVGVTARVAGDAPAALRPGAFAEVWVPLEAAGEAAVVPQAAIRPSERGFLAYVVEGGVARERTLELGLRTPDGDVEVRAGLRPGDALVVRGAEALRDGAAVRVVKDRP